ncbi:helix-turn-helix domain-containing protein [Actinoplanes aureus]|uniref:Helix-turn-helix transcriptional regulator n=1 Tax=Actinoplanes aureus TaxID=2792083 RepID=A0A931C3U2_9ACTN|nr:XRE family transcriptional regulator [Actinoplanes aureus]MBG0561709.1 helix-turn-helix transcriptional regulator [Actinoplanes aureus]
MTDDLTQELAATLRAARTDRELSVNALADRSGVSRAMIAKIERGEAQPTAALLGRLAAALGLTLSELFARTEGESPRLARRAEQTVWVDPETGYQRRSVSPAAGSVQVVEVELPGGASVDYPADAFAIAAHQIYVLAGRLHFHEGELRHDLAAGDCLELGAPAPCTYRNPTGEPCRYLVILTPRRPR